jgi:hypothetical protein
MCIALNLISFPFLCFKAIGYFVIRGVSFIAHGGRGWGSCLCSVRFVK